MNRPPLILRAASGRHSIQCRHGLCEFYRSGFPTGAAAQVVADTHMADRHGVVAAK